LEPVQRSTVMTVALEVARRTASPERIEASLTAVQAAPGYVGWAAQAVAQGDAGLALMCGQLARCVPDQEWDVAAHHFLILAVDAAERARVLGPALFNGLSGLLFVATTLAQEGSRYERLQTAIDEALLVRTGALVSAVAACRSGVDPALVDVVSGLSGIGAALLSRRKCPNRDATLAKILVTLIAHARSSEGCARWRSSDRLTPIEARAFPEGRLDLGLAHGIPGPLALMALASRNGIELPGQREAMRLMCDWLVERRLQDQWGVTWPSMGSAAADFAVARGPSRTAWCYGTPGVARALWLSGEAMDDSALRSLAVDAMDAVHRTPVERRGIDAPTFCHGVSGLLQITLRFAHETGRVRFRDAAATLVGQLLAAYEPQRLFGYRAAFPGAHLDNPGLLDGSAGIALVLLAAATDVEPVWDRFFLLS
jgi:lantibiotic modifying enzyme